VVLVGTVSLSFGHGLDFGLDDTPQKTGDGPLVRCGGGLDLRMELGWNKDLQTFPFRSIHRHTHNLWMR
jgi:hypothetical protein